MDLRYARQQRFIGVDAQELLSKARIVIIGCGALGCASADMLVRAGIGSIRLIDRDFVELHNLQRQCLYTEQDVINLLPKAVAAERRLQAVNSSVHIEGILADFNAENADELLADCDLLIDGSDSFQTRHILNEWACKHGKPWVYAACVGDTAVSMPIIPGKTPCFACIQEELPAAGDAPGCDTSGIIAPAVQMAASWQVSLAIRILIGDEVESQCFNASLFSEKTRVFSMQSWRLENCRACSGSADYPYSQEEQKTAISLCGRNGVQVYLPNAVKLDALAKQLSEQLKIKNDYLLRCEIDELEVTLFKDGRMIVQGTQDETQVRSLIARHFS